MNGQGMYRHADRTFPVDGVHVLLIFSVTSACSQDEKTATGKGDKRCTVSNAEVIVVHDSDSEEELSSGKYQHYRMVLSFFGMKRQPRLLLDFIRCMREVALQIFHVLLIYL